MLYHYKTKSNEMVKLYAVNSMPLLKIAKWCGSGMVLPIDRDPIYKQSRYNGCLLLSIILCKPKCLKNEKSLFLGSGNKCLKWKLCLFSLGLSHLWRYSFIHTVILRVLASITIGLAVIAWLLKLKGLKDFSINFCTIYYINIVFT